MTAHIKKIVIVGGGTAGWMAAASLKHFFKQNVTIALVESADIGTIGVGEATIPTIRNFYHQLGMHDLDVMRATQATCKLGIQFNDWHKKGSTFIHPFGHFGQPVRGVDFHHYWMKLHQLNSVSDFGDYSLGVMLAKHNKFTLPAQKPTSVLSAFDWALHFDAGLFAQHMRKFAEANEVERIEATINVVKLDATTGNIQSLQLDSGAEVTGDLFIDCSGFRALLIEGALKTGYESWEQWLLCNSAYAVQSKATEAPRSYTRVNAQTAGWQWQIPLQHRMGNGHVYSNQFMSDDEACAILKNNIQGELLAEPRKINFTAGRRKKAWNKNCIAIGLSAGFLEPLESTSIALIQTGIEKIKDLLCCNSYSQATVDEFNETTALEYERVRDFLILHYKATARDDSAFWRHCNAMEIPTSLQHKMELFKASGHVVNYRWEMFHLPSWLAIFTGFDYLPDNYHAMVDNFDVDEMKTSFENMKKSIASAVTDSYDHADFIAQYCAASAK